MKFLYFKTELLVNDSQTFGSDVPPKSNFFFAHPQIKFVTFATLPNYYFYYEDKRPEFAYFNFESIKPL